jgi:hypothetical protein
MALHQNRSAITAQRIESVHGPPVASRVVARSIVQRYFLNIFEAQPAARHRGAAANSMPRWSTTTCYFGLSRESFSICWLAIWIMFA